MDLRIYYQKVREIEAGIGDEYPVVVSKDTTDGGKEGTLTEVPRRLAARMAADGLARLATSKEAAAYRERVADAARKAEQAAAAARLQISVVTARDLEQLRADVLKQTKG